MVLILWSRGGVDGGESEKETTDIVSGTQDTFKIFDVGIYEILSKMVYEIYTNNKYVLVYSADIKMVINQGII